MREARNRSYPRGRLVGPDWGSEYNQTKPRTVGGPKFHRKNSCEDGRRLIVAAFETPLLILLVHVNSYARRPASSPDLFASN